MFGEDLVAFGGGPPPWAIFGGPRETVRREEMIWERVWGGGVAGSDTFKGLRGEFRSVGSKEIKGQDWPCPNDVV